MKKSDVAKGFIGYLSAVQLKFFPDIVETKLVRNNQGQIDLVYKEYFTYLPEEVLNTIIPISMKVSELLFKKMGFEFNLKKNRTRY